MKNYVFKHPSNSLIQYYMYQPIENPKPNSKNYSDIFIKHIVMMVCIILNR